MAKLFAHAATTRNIHVRVAVSYLPEQSAPQAGRWFWSYHVRIENDGDRPVQLLSRHWRIRDSRAVEQEVRGEGVVGETPLIKPGGSFDYVSGCPLDSPSGSMRGSYRMMADDGSMFDVEIPEFALRSPV
ncbi:MAG: Co2+/Mg2+ efflux protein ApaG [Sphingomonas bacterium]|nr:Co2+/Mg2+ efflux protein ApaG [Sphingomonas bacterium]